MSLSPVKFDVWRSSCRASSSSSPAYAARPHDGCIRDCAESAGRPGGARPPRTSHCSSSASAVEAVGALLDARGIELHPRAAHARVRGRRLRLFPDGTVEADRVIALPRLRAAHPAPQTVEGFVPVDPHGRVTGLEERPCRRRHHDVSVKQGGIATQQADAAAETIAALAGAQVAPEPFQPVLRGLLLTGGASVPSARHQRRVRRRVGRRHGASVVAAREDRRAIPGASSASAGLDSTPDAPPPSGAVLVDVEIDEDLVARLTRSRFEVALAEAAEDARTVGEEMSTVHRRRARGHARRGRGPDAGPRPRFCGRRRLRAADRHRRPGSGQGVPSACTPATHACGHG